mgnify:CR=1 FL=1
MSTPPIIISDPRAKESDGWERIGAIDAARRRSIWMKLDEIDLAALSFKSSNIKRIELCAGREGSDFYCVIDRSNPQFGELLELFLFGRYAVSMEKEP